MRQIVRLLVISLIALLISIPLIAGGHDYVPYPVIFIHGFNADIGSWSTTKQNLGYLYNSKYDFSSAAQYFPDMNYGAQKLGDFSKNGDCTYIADKGNSSLKAVIDAVLENSQMINLPPEEKKVIIVAHSFGGLVTRALLKQDPSMQDKIAKVVFVGVPHQGSSLASALWIFKEVDAKLDVLINKYANSTNILSTPLINNTTVNNTHLSILGRLIAFKEDIQNTIQESDSLWNVLDIDPYGKAIEQCRLNEYVYFKKVFNDYGIIEVLEKYHTGGETFLGNSANLGTPSIFSTIYAETGSPSKAGEFMKFWFNLRSYAKYFAFPAGESFDEIGDKGDVVVSSESQRLVGATHQYKLPDVAHFGGLTPGECEQYETIREVLCEEKPIIKVKNPSIDRIYTTYIPLQVKLKDYLPLDCQLTGLLYKQGYANAINSFVLKYVPNQVMSAIHLNKNYEEGSDNYQAIVSKIVEHNQPYDMNMALVLSPTNAAGIEGSPQTIQLKYECLVSTNTPANNEQNISVNTPIQITFKQKIRQATVQNVYNNIVITPYPGPYTPKWIDEYTVILTLPKLEEDTDYTVTLKGDDPGDGDDFSTQDFIENLTGIEYYLTDPNAALDRYGFDPDYSFSFHTEGGSSSGGIVGIADAFTQWIQFKGPDESFDVNKGNYDFVSTINSLPGQYDHILVLKTGYYKFATNILNTCGRYITYVNPDFKAEDIKQYPVLLIPSSGLYGLETVESFKQNLAVYAANGGTVICMTQPYGANFIALPGNKVSGIGYAEDQSCHTMSSYIKQYHPIFSSQETANEMDFDIDGYFLSYPTDAKTLLIRSKNNNPCLINYAYGQGQVYATTLYTDWGLPNGQSSTAELNLFRDLLNYSENKNASITEFTPGQIVDTTFKVQNLSTDSAQQVYIKIYGPDGTTIASEILPLTADLQPGQETLVEYKGTEISNWPLGIFRIYYKLLNNQGTLIEGDKYAGKFSVTNKLVGNPPAYGDFIFNVSCQDELFLNGSVVSFVYTITNLTDQNRIIHYASLGSGLWCDVFVPAHKSVSVNDYFLALVGSSWGGSDFQRILNIIFYNGPFTGSAGQVVGQVSKLIDIYNFKYNLVSITNPKYIYEPGEIPSIKVNMSNNKESADEYSLELKITNKSNEVVCTKTDIFNLAAKESLIKEYILEGNYSTGNFIIRAKYYCHGQIVGDTSSIFEIPAEKITVEPILPEVFDLNSTVNFKINNIGIGDIYAGKIIYELRNSISGIIYSGAKEFGSIKSQAALTFTIDAPVETPNYGQYKITYKIYYNAKELQGAIDIPNNIIIENIFEKSIYSIGETVTGKFRIVNNGKIQHNDIPIYVKWWTTNWYDKNLVTETHLKLGPGEESQIDYKQSLNLDMYIGAYKVEVGNTGVNNTYTFTIPPAKLNANLEKLTIPTGELVHIKITNTGGVPKNIVGEYLLYNKNNICFSGGLIDLPNTIDPVSEVDGTLFVWNGVDTGDYVLRILLREAKAYYYPAIMDKSFSVNILKTDVGISLEPIEKLTIGENMVSFAINNSGDANIDNIKLQLTLSDPSGQVVFSNEQPCADVLAHSSSTINMLVQLTDVTSGNYSLDYKLAYGYNQAVANSYQIPSSIKVSSIYGISSDSYKATEPLDFNVELINGGVIDRPSCLLRATLLPCGVSEKQATPVEKSVDINVLEKALLNFNIPIPEDVVPGKHDIKIELIENGQPVWTTYSYYNIGKPLLSIEAQRSVCRPGDPVSLEILNSGGAGINFITYIKLFNNSYTWQIEKESQYLAVNGIKTITFNIPSECPEGPFKLAVVCRDAIDPETGYYKYYSSLNKDIEILNTTAELILTPVLSNILTTDMDLNCSVRNVGVVEISSATVTAEIIDPNSQLVYAKEEAINNIQPEQIITLTEPVQLDNILFGEYKIKYTLSYLGKNTVVENKAVSAITLKGISLSNNSYNVNEVVNATAIFTNTGAFRQELNVVSKIPALNLERTDPLTLDPGQSVSLPLSFTLPADSLAGPYNLEVSCQTSTGTVSEDQIVKGTADFGINPGILSMSMAKTNYNAGEKCAVDISNIGGANISYQSTLKLLTQSNVIITQCVESALIMPDAAKTMAIAIPENIAAGTYYLNFEYLVAGNLQQWNRSISINGITADLTIDTTKDIYRLNEDATTIGNLSANNVAQDPLNLNIKVYRASEAWTNYVNTNTILDILVDGDYVWFMTSKGLKRYDQINDSWKDWGVAEGIVSYYFSGCFYDLGTVKMLFSDTESIYFIGSDDYSCNNNIVYQVNKTTGQVVACNFPANCYGSAAILGFRNNKLLIETGSSHKLLQFDIEKKSLAILDYATILQQSGSQYYSAILGFTFDGQSIWIMTLQEIYKLNADDSVELIVDKMNIFDSTYYWNSSIRFKADAESLWIQKDTSDYQTFTAKIELCRIDKTSKTMASFSLDIPFYSSRPDFVVGDKELWFLTPGVIKFDKASNTFEQYSHQIVTLNTRVISFANDDVWIGNNRYNRLNDSWTTYTQADGLISTNINAVVANGNNVWFGTNEGISRYDLTANWQDFKDEILLDRTKQAYPDNEYVWFTTENGLVKYSKDNDQFTKLDVNATVFCVGDDYNWLVADKLYQIDKTSNQLTELPLGTINPYTIGYICQEGNYLWLLCGNSLGTEGLVKYDLNTKTAEEYPAWYQDYYNNSYKIIPYGDQIWIIAKDQLRKFSKIDQTISAMTWPQSLQVNGCTYDNGLLWLLTSNSLVKYDMVTEEIAKTIAYPGAAYNMAGTAINLLNGNIWITINSYDYSKVAKYNVSLDKWTVYTSNNGLINGVVSYIASDISYIWFVADCGVSRLKEKGTILWQKDLALNGSGTINFNELVGQLGETGKFYVEGTATNSIGQQLAKAENSFYVTTSNVAMTMNADKKLYKTGETINITGEVVNSGILDENSIQMSLERVTGNISAGSYALAAGAKQSFTASTIADKSFLLTGKTVCGTEENVVEEYISVVDPALEMTVTGPDTAGQDSFDLGILVKNSGQVEASGSGKLVEWYSGTAEGEKDIGQFTLKPGETKYISQSCQISKDTNFEIKLTGDAAQNITKAVKFGCAAVVTITPDPVYPASTATNKQIFEIPVTITNTGTVDMLLNAKYQISDSSGKVVEWYSEKTKEYYVPGEGGVYDNLVLEGAPAGDYILNYVSDFVSGSALVRVAEFNTVVCTDLQYTVSGSTITVNAKVKNTGANEFVGNFAGNLKQGEAKAFETEQELNLAINEEKIVTFEVPTTNLTTGNYFIGAVVLHNGFEIASRNTDIALQSDFSMTAFDDNQIFNAGSQAAIKVKVKNTGSVEGQATVNLASGDIVNSTQTTWLKSGEEQELTFNFVPADDLEEKTYIGYITVDNQQLAVTCAEQQVKFYVNGYKIGVTSSFDQLAYTEGETAKLTLTLTNEGSLEASVFTKVNFNDYQVTTTTTTVTKGIPVNLTFNVPVHHTGAKLFYGVYHENGRSLNLNTLYVNKQEGSISAIADQQQYQAGGNVTLTFLPLETGILTLEAPGYQTELNIVTADTQTITFALPVDIVTGTHYINYNFTPSTGTVLTGKLPIDVVGYTIVAMETILDKTTYYPNETIKFKTRINSNKDVSNVQLKIWLKNSDKVVEWYGGTVNITAGQNMLSAEVPMTLADKGMGQLIFGLYKGELLLSAGQRAFDIDIYDTVAPITEIQVSSPQFVVNGEIYVTDQTGIYFVATDSGTAPSGIDYMEYKIDEGEYIVVPSTSTLSLYHSITLPLLSEGEHTVNYRSKDKAGNLEETKQAVYYLDNTAPVSSIQTPATSYLLPDGSIYFVSPATFTITANDSSSGIDHIEYRIDNSTTPVIITNSSIDLSLMLADGNHSLQYFAVDKIGNVEAEKTLNFLIDGNAPVSQLKVIGSQFAVSGNTYINQDAKIELTATDSGAGLNHINYRADAGTATIVYTEPFSYYQEGQHTLYYSAIDKLGIVETEKIQVLYLDATTPETSFKISDANYEVTEGTTTYANSSIPFLISAVDPVSNGVSSGLKHIKTKVDANNYSTILSSSCYISANSPDGLHTIAYYSVDNVENPEIVRTYTAIFDGTKPVIKSTYPANNAKVKAKSATPITITFSEPVQSADWSKDIIIQKGNGKQVKNCSFTYDPLTFTVSINCELENNTNYQVILKDTISDRVRNYLESCWFSFRTMMSAAEGGNFTDQAAGLTVIVPPDCLPIDGYFEIALLNQSNPPKLPKPLTWLFNGQKAYQVIFYDENGIIVQLPVKKSFQVLLSLNQQWITLALESDPMEYKNIKVYQTGSVTDFIASMAHQAVSANTAKGQFAPRLLTEQSYNAEAQQLIVDLDTFGIFSLAGFNAPGTSLDDLSCYPNPFNPCQQNITIQYYLENDSEVAVAIYDLLGNLVKTWEIPAGEMYARSGLNTLSWDGRNGQGDIVANGGYIVFVHSDGQKKKFKVLVVK